MAQQTSKFNAASPGFLYSVIVAILTILAGAGVTFPKEVTALGMELYTSFSTGGVYAIIGIVVASIIFPIYNSRKNLTLKTVFTSTLTWVAIANALVAILALSGFMLPEGTVEQIVGAVVSRDWMGLLSIIALTVGNTLLRWLKDRKTVVTPVVASVRAEY